MSADEAPVASLLAQIQAATGADRGVGLFLDSGDGSLARVAQAGPRQSPRARLTPRPRLSWQPDGSAFDRDGQIELVVVPGQRAGLLALERAGGRPFSPEDRSVARLLARQLSEVATVGVPVGRSPGRPKRLEDVLALTGSLGRCATEDDVVEVACTGLRELLGCVGATVHLVGGERSALDTPARPDGDAVGLADAGRTRAGTGTSVAHWVVSNDRPLIIPDTRLDARVATNDELERKPGSLLLAPIREAGSPVGVMVAERSGPDQFDADDLWVLTTVAEMVGGAIGRARLIASRDRLIQELEILLEISRAGATVDDEPALARSLAARLRKAVRADACVISGWDDEGGLLRVVGWDGSMAPDFEPGGWDILESPVTRQVLLDGVPQLVHGDSSEIAPAERARMDSMGIGTRLMLPLVAMERPVGLADLYLLGQARDVAPDEVETCRKMASHVAVALDNARQLAQLRLAADTDQLTRAATHRHLQERLRQEVARSSRAGAQFAVLMVDLDGFKAINDRHGHDDGNRVLRNVAAGLKLAVRASDIVARFGGDEFVVLMPDTDEKAAKVVAKRIVAGVAGQRHQLNDGSVARLTCSVGLAVYPEDGRTGAALLKSADAAMYMVKREGGRDVRRGTRPPRSAKVLARLTPG
jgi:diguanylate cyclase (GGDEF)-like protein